MPIQVLDAYTAAQIAAGEVVERPASIVKELVENAVDAGATEIRVDVRGGGKREIRNVDNGGGIPADEVELAFQRHATSKLRSADDLYAIHTLGFRGEALPSIATVAQIICQTRTSDADIGVELRVDGGAVVSRVPHGGVPGTTFIVRNLFFNLPVRLKFLKSDAAEAAKVSEIVTGYALAYPEIRWTFISEGAVQLQTSGSGKLLDAIVAVYQVEIARDMIPVDDAEGQGEMHTHIHGYVTRPTLSRGTRAGIHLFVNRRAMKSTAGINLEVRTAYHTLLAKERHPFAVLNIDVDPGTVDVNVHPAKTEVKFRFEEQVQALVGRAIRQALANDPGGSMLSVAEREHTPMMHQDPAVVPATPSPASAPSAVPAVPEADGPSVGAWDQAELPVEAALAPVVEAVRPAL